MRLRNTAAEREKALQGGVSLIGQRHEDISAQCGGAWNKSPTRNNYCTSISKPLHWAHSGLSNNQAPACCFILNPVVHELFMLLDDMGCDRQKNNPVCSLHQLSLGLWKQSSVHKHTNLKGKTHYEGRLFKYSVHSTPEKTHGEVV